MFKGNRLRNLVITLPPQHVQSQGSGFGLIVGASSALLTLTTGLMYLCGMSYWEGYYSYFGVDVTALDLPFWKAMVGSAGPIAWLWGIGVVIWLIYPTLRWVATTVDGWWQSYVSATEDKRKRKLGSVVIGLLEALAIAGLRMPSVAVWILALSLLASLVERGSKDGKQEARKDEHILRKVSLTMRAADEELSPRLAKLNRAGALRLLTQTNNVLVVCPAIQEKRSPTDVFFVSRASLISFRTEY